MSASGPIRLHVVRHGRVASHRGDVAVTEEGLREVEAAAQRFAAQIEDGEVVAILITATRRSRETAEVLYRSLHAEIVGASQIDLRTPVEEPAIRNPDIYIGGLRVEMVSTGAAMAEQTVSIGLQAEEIERLPFYRDFFPSRDRVGYWVAHPHPPGENADAVARRVMGYAASLSDLLTDLQHRSTGPAAPEHPTRLICVTHSPVMRAFLTRYVTTEDPGEPEFMESIDLTVHADRSVSIRYREHETVHRLATIGTQSSAAR